MLSVAEARLLRCSALAGQGEQPETPDPPGLRTQGDTLDEAAANAQEALDLHVEGLREEGRSLDAGVMRRKFPAPA